MQAWAPHCCSRLLSAAAASTSYHVAPPRFTLRRKHPAASRASSDDIEQSTSQDGAPSMGKLRYNKRQQLPKELQDVSINEQGFLVDSTTGKVINEFGATRFDVAVRALRGELDPPAWVENTERNPGVLMGSLVQFPCDYLFSVVGKVAAAAPSNGSSSSSSNGASNGSSSSSRSGSSSEDEMMQQPKCSSSSSRGGEEADALYSHPFVQDVVACISRCCQVEVPREAVTVTPRLKGKYLSVGVSVRVRAPEIVARTYEELGKDTRVTMKF